MCRIALTAAIVGAWLLWFSQKFCPSHNCPNVTNVGEIWLSNWRRKSRRLVVVAICRRRSKRTVVVTIFLGTKVSGKEWTTRRLETWECSGQRCPRKEKRHREHLSILGRRSGVGKVLGFSRLQKDARTFFLGLPVRRVCCMFSLLLMRWKTFRNHDEEQNMTTTVTQMKTITHSTPITEENK